MQENEGVPRRSVSSGIEPEQGYGTGIIARMRLGIAVTPQNPDCLSFVPDKNLPNKWAFITQALTEREAQNRRRVLSPVQPIDAVQVKKDGRTLINFSANDYLGLAKHPAVMTNATKYTLLYGTGATASRLVAGTFEIHAELEAKLAQAVGKEAALLFGTGFQCNATVLPVLLDREALVLGDRLIHNSLIQGILASKARLIRYPHNDLVVLETQLQKAQRQSYSRILIVSETVFSMDGDRSDVAALGQLAQRYNAILYLDDAHALGVLGPEGMGLAAHQPGVDLVVGTFGKAFGAFGAFVACSALVREYLVNCCPGVIYTTALPPGVIGSIEAALELVPGLTAQRQALHAQAQRLREGLHRLGYDTAQSSSQIVPAIVGADEVVLRLAQGLEAQGLLAAAIRPPTVPEGTARLRFSLSACHQPSQIDALVAAMAQGEK